MAKRALVALIRTLGATYSVQVSCCRESADAIVVASSFREVVLRTHPDRGGNQSDQQRLNDARAQWDAVPRSSVPVSVLATAKKDDKKSRKEYRIQSEAVLLTYQGFPSVQSWPRFLSFIEARLAQWNVKHWSATLELNLDRSPHAHLMLQFKAQVDRTTATFVYERIRPNASVADLCGEGMGRRKPQQSMNRGFFYVWADKVGTCRNYSPCWAAEGFRYQVLGAWPEQLWKQRKLSSAMYKKYLHLARDGVPFRKRNLEEVLQEEERLELSKEIAATSKRLRSDPSLFQVFPVIPEASAWLELFKKDAARYPLLIVLGASMSGKTEWAKSLFQHALELKMGCLAFFPDGLRGFDRKAHDVLILDDVRDLKFLTDNQDKLQGKHDAALEFASTPGGQCKYEKYLYKVPIVVTANFSTANLSYLDSHNWLSNPGNRTVVHYQGWARPSAQAA
ncbi:unnamed protein product [Polarella glacialis]|uniref:Replication-associated protein n=1 Tax=Polarella glacialis TaxID=89957 RepID=A0A813J820_POLGL|nr:unnamed protein product [Polarella glacialis]